MMLLLKDTRNKNCPVVSQAGPQGASYARWGGGGQSDVGSLADSAHACRSSRLFAHAVMKAERHRVCQLPSSVVNANFRASNHLRLLYPCKVFNLSEKKGTNTRTCLRHRLSACAGTGECILSRLASFDGLPESQAWFSAPELVTSAQGSTLCWRTGNKVPLRAPMVR